MNKRNLLLGIGLLIILLIFGVIYIKMKGDEPMTPSPSSHVNDEESGTIVIEESQAPGEPESTIESTSPAASTATDADQREDQAVETVPRKDPDRLPRTFAIEGYVRNPEGSVMEDVEVQVLRHSSYGPTGRMGSGDPMIQKTELIGSVITDAVGYYMVPVDSGRPLILALDVPGYKSEAVQLYSMDYQSDRVDENHIYTQYDFDLEAARLVTVLIQDESGNPLEDVSAEFAMKARRTSGNLSRASTTRELKSGKDGTLLLSVSPGAKNLSIELEKEGFQSKKHMVELLSDEVVITMISGGGFLEGTVFLGSTDYPLAGAPVEIYTSEPPYRSNADPVGFQSMTDEEGRFRFENLQAYKWELIAWERDGAKTDLIPFNSLEVVVGEQEEVTGVELIIPDMGTEISLQIIDADSDKPIAEATMSGQAANPLPVELRGMKTDAKGFFDISGVKLTEKQFIERFRLISVEAPGYMPQRVIDYFNDEQISEIRETHQIQVYLQPSQMVNLYGQIMDWNGQPAEGILVQAVYEFSSEVSDATDGLGRYELDVWANTPLALSMKNHEIPENWSEKMVLPFEDTEYHHILDPGGNLLVTLLDPDENPEAEQSISIARHIFSDNGSSSADFYLFKTTDSKGQVLLEKVPSSNTPLSPRYSSAELHVGATHPDYESYTEDDIRINPLETTEVVIILSPKDRSAWIDGIVSDEKGDPVEGAIIKLNASEFEIFNETRSDVLGVFSFEEQKATKYRLGVNHPEFRYYRQDVVLPLSELKVELTRRTE